MMKTMDTWMILLFPFLDSLPFTLPRYWIYRGRLRIPFRYIVLVQFLLSAAYSGAFYYINLGGYEAAARWTTIMRYSFMLIFLAMAFLLIKDRFSKLMFTWLLFLAWQFFVLGHANFIESRFFWDFSDRHPYLVYNIARVAVYLVTCPFLLRFFCHTVKDALDIDDGELWRHFWKIPLFSTLFGMLYCTVTDVYAFASWQFLVSRYLMLLGACYVSYVALRVLEISRSRGQLEAELEYMDKNLLAQKKQFDGLSAHMDAMRRFRHDLRQHLTVMQSCIERGDQAGLLDYIDIYKSELPPDTMEQYCRNDMVNAVICCYASQARDNRIRFEAKADYPDGCPILVTDITVLLGNLLENSVEACKRETGDRKFIKLCMKQRGSAALIILVDNTCLAPVKFDGELPVSSQGNRAGIGVASVCEIASRYGGTVEFEQRDGIFCASVFLQIPRTKNQMKNSRDML